MHHAVAEQPNHHIMITPLKRFALLLSITSLLAIASQGCNTAHGFGQDMEKAGEKIQNGTK